MHFFKILSLDLLLSHQSVTIPESNESHLCFQVEADPEFDVFPDRNAMNAEAQIVEGDSAIGIDGPLEAVAENIVECLVGLWNDKGPEETSLLLSGFFETQRRDLSGRRVNSLVPVLIDFPIQNFPSLLDRPDSVPHARSDQMILKPAIGPFDLSLGCRTQSIDDFDAQIPQDCFPLNDRILFFGLGLLPDGVPSFDEPKDRMVVDVVLQRTANARHDCLGGHDVGP